MACFLPFSHNTPTIDSNPWVLADLGGILFHVNGALPLNSWTPQLGEMVGTPAQFGPAGPTQERTNIVLVRWP